MNESISVRLQADNQALRSEVDDRKRAENLLRLQRDLALGLGSTSDLDDALQLVLATAMRIEGIDCGGLYVLNEQTGALTLGAHQGISPQFAEKVARYEAGSERLQLVSAGKPVYRRFDEFDFNQADDLLQEGFRAFAVLPVQDGGEVVAVLNLASRSCDEIPPSARDAVETIAAQIGAVLVRLRMETSLRRNQNNLEKLLNTLDDFVFVADQEGRIVHVNSQVLRRLKYDLDEVLGKSVMEMHPPEHRAEAARIFGEMLAGKTSTCPLPLLAKDETRINVEMYVARSEWNGQPVMFGIARDVSERVRRERQLREENAFREAVIKGAAEGLAVCRDITEYPHLRFSVWNDRMVEITGYTIDEINRLGWYETLHPDVLLRETVNSYTPELSQGVGFRDREWIITRKDGQRRTLLISTSLLATGGPPKHMLALTQDITERQEMERALHDSQERLAGILDAVTDHISIIDEQSNIVWTNSVGKELFGCDLVGNKCHRVYHGTELPCPECLVQKTFADGQSHEHETKVVSAQGERVFWCTSSVAARHEDGRPRLVIEISRDITDRKQAEEDSRQHLSELAHVTRLATMGEMASEMAHEINQPLTAIASYAGTGFNTLERSDSSETRQLRDLLTRIEQQAIRAGQIVRRLRGFVRRTAPTRTVGHLNDLVRNTLSLIDSELKQSEVSLHLDLADALPSVTVDPIQIEQVVLNLMKNAVEAISDSNNGKRRLTVATRQATAHEALVSVSDTGGGIPAENLERIFDAFFTTKSAGMGMGLAISRSILEAHGGRLWVTSNLEQGCTFHFALPTSFEGRRPGAERHSTA